MSWTLESDDPDARGIITESPLVLVDVTTDAGVVGHGMVFTYLPAALGPTATLIENFGDMLLGLYSMEQSGFFVTRAFSG